MWHVGPVTFIDLFCGAGGFFEILDGPDTSVPLAGANELKHKQFETRLEAGAYLKTRKSRLGGQNRSKPGTVRLFVGLIYQCYRTFDLYSMSGRPIMELLPGEFPRFKPFIVNHNKQRRWLSLR